MRPALRAGAALALLCLLPTSLADYNGVNTDETATHHPCTNTFNGNTTSATEIDGAYILGCGNVVSNNTLPEGSDNSVIDIEGSRNTVSNNVQVESGHSFTVIGSDNKVLNNEADYLYIGWHGGGQAVNGNDIENNHARGGREAAQTDSYSGFIGLEGAENNTIIGNTADYVGFWRSKENDVENNYVRGAEDYRQGGGGLQVSTDASDNVIKNNVADYIWVSDATNNDVENNVAEGFLGVYNTKNSVSKNNKFSDSWLSTDTSVTVESNDADYDLEVYYSSNDTVVKNTANKIYVYSDSDVHVERNKVDTQTYLEYVTNSTLINNTVYEIDLYSVSDEVISNEAPQGSAPVSIGNNGVHMTQNIDGSQKPTYTEGIRFSNPGAGAIYAIADKLDGMDAIGETEAMSTAVSVAAVRALVANLTAQLAAAQGAVAAAAQASSAAAANSAALTALTTQVDTLKSGFCPPAAAAGRHLLSDLVPIVPPAECAKTTTPPAAVTSPTHVVTTTLSLSAINPATFSTASVAAALAATAGVNAADVDVVVTDFPVSSTVSFTGVALTSLTAAQTSAITAAIDANLPAAAMTPTLGAVTPAGRRLLDLSFPVTVTGVGASTTLAQQTQTAVTSAATLSAAATAASVPSSAVTATPATVSATMSVTVRAASASSATAIATALSPANSAAISQQLATAGVSNSGVTIAAPVVAAAAPAAGSSSGSTENKDLYALLVLLIIPIANIAYFGGKYIERRRALKAAEQAQAKVDTPAVVVETA